MSFGRFAAGLLAAAGLTAGILLVGSCKGVPTVAPEGAVITMFANPLEITIEGSSALTISVFEVTGQPVPNGTRVTLTTTAGRVEPSDLEVRGGFGEATLHAGPKAGVATVTASSGRASSGTVTITIGGAADTVSLVATPTTLAVGGGNVTLVATVRSGLTLPVAGQRVTFGTTRGTLGSGGVPVVTDAKGEARDVLTTDADCVVKVTLLGSDATDDAVIDVAGTGAASIVVTASPVAVGPFLPGETATVSLSATALNGSGNPVSDLPVVFKTSSGILATTGLQYTNGAGIASNSIVVHEAATVTVRSGGASGTATISLTGRSTTTHSLAAYPVQINGATVPASFQVAQCPTDPLFPNRIDITLTAEVLRGTEPAEGIPVTFFSSEVATTAPGPYGYFCEFATLGAPVVDTDADGLAVIHYTLSQGELQACLDIATPCPPTTVNPNVCPPAGSGQTASNKCCCAIKFSARVGGATKTVQYLIHSELGSVNKPVCGCAF